MTDDLEEQSQKIAEQMLELFGRYPSARDALERAFCSASSRQPYWRGTAPSRS
jgi:hypothetical protein